MRDPFGFGPLRPFQRDGRSDFVAGGGTEAVRSAVGQILGTVGASETTDGELPWRPELGSLLTRLRHQKNDVILQELARVYVVEALARWEPRVAVTSVSATRETRDGANVLRIRLRYDVVSTNVSAGGASIRDVEQDVVV